MWRRQPVRTGVIGLATAVFLVCCVLPIVYLLATALTDGSRTPVTSLLLDARQRGLLYNTAFLGVGTALCATVLGVPLGTALARVPLRRKGFARLALAAPALLPPYIVALAWVYLGGSRGLLATAMGRDVLSEWTYSLPAAIAVLSVVFYPLSMLATEVAMRRIDGRLEEAALVVAPPARVLWRITLPLAAPSVLAAALVIFVLAVSEFGVPGLLRVRVYTTEVFTAFAALYDFTRAMLMAVPLLVVCAVIAAAAAALAEDRLVTPRRRTGTPPPLVESWHRPAELLVAGVMVAALGLPVGILAREALSTRSLAAVFAGSGDAIANSLALSALGATVIVSVAVWLGYARARAGRRVGQLVDMAFVVLFAVPSTIVGVGLIGLWNRPGLLGMAYGTDVMVLLAYLARFLPVAALILAAVIRYVPLAHEEAAAVSGAGWLRTMARIVAPQVRLGVSTAWLITFVLAFGELGATILVTPPGESTLPIRIYTIIANTPASHVATLALLQTAVIFTPLALIGAAFSVRPSTCAQGVPSVVEGRLRR
ncbi:MAG: ABC transporter permease [Vicinamibacteraceae bacterium]